MGKIFESGWQVFGFLALVGGCLVAAYFALGIGFRTAIDHEGKRESQELIDKPAPEGHLDTEAGNYRGVSFGDSPQEVKSVLGDALPGPSYGQPGLVGFHDPWLDPNPRCGEGKRSKMAYREVIFVFSEDSVCGIVVSGGGWSTSQGVTAGDSIGDFEDDNPASNCFDESTTEEGLGDQRSCKVRTKADLLLWVGGDPVNTVALTSGRLR